MINKQASILVIGNHADDLDIAHCLSQNGFKVTTASSGEKALLLATTKPPDLILLDAMTPVMDGFETCLWLKKQFVLSDVPIIVLTMKNESHCKEKFFNLGAAGYIEKPLVPSILLSWVRIYLTKKHTANFRQDMY